MSSYFQAGLLLEPDAFYVRRAVDDALFAQLSRMEPAVLLAPRQVGKSSLCNRVARRLVEAHQDEGMQVVYVEDATVGVASVVRDEQHRKWYYGLGKRIAEALGLVEAFRTRWNEDQERVPLERFRAFLLHDVCTEGARTRDARRFALGELLKYVDDFTREEAEALAPGLAALPGGASPWLDAVYAWTEGHPALMQALCESFVDDLPATPAADDVVAERASGLFLRRGRIGHPIFADTDRRFGGAHQGVLDPKLPQTLDLYRRVLAGEIVKVSEGDAKTGEDDVLQRALRVGGLVAFRDGRVWRASSGDLVVTLQGHIDGVRHATFAPDATVVATASDDTTVRLWNAHAPRLVTVLNRGEDGLVNVAMSHDGSRVAAALENGAVVIRSAASGQALRVLSGHRSRVIRVSFSPDDARVLSASEDALTADEDGAIFLWNLAPTVARTVACELLCGWPIWSDPARAELHAACAGVRCPPTDAPP